MSRKHHCIANQKNMYRLWEHCTFHKSCSSQSIVRVSGCVYCVIGREAVRGTVNVVTSLCADWNWRPFHTSNTPESKVCKARAGQLRTMTGNPKSSSVGSVRHRIRSRRRCLRVRPQLARSRVNSTTRTSRAL